MIARIFYANEPGMDGFKLKWIELDVDNRRLAQVLI